VGPYGEETDDDHPKRRTEDETREERVHDRRPFPPRWGRSLRWTGVMSNCCATFSRRRLWTPSPTGDHRDARAVDETDTRRPAGAPATLTLLTFPLVAFRLADGALKR